MASENADSVPDLSKIPDGQVWGLYTDNVEAAISGAYRVAFYNDGRVTLIYTDETKEVAKFPLAEAQKIAEAGRDNWFSIVSAVQGRRGK